MEQEAAVIRCIEKIRPFLQRDGGDVEFVSLKDNIAFVRVHGACVGCVALDYTIKDGVEAIIMDEVEGIQEVRVVE